jgi:hypothetical protein
MAKYKLDRLASLSDVIDGLGKTLRAMASGELDSQTGARICNGLGIMRACLETVVLQSIEEKLERVAQRAITSAAASSRAPIQLDEEANTLQ